MPVRFKTSTEYDRNYKWRMSYDENEDPSPMSRWAGLRSDELGITKEPSFPSKRRVPYYHPQISKSFQWKENGDYVKERVKLDGDIEKDFLVKEKIITPDAPRLKKKARSKSAVPRTETDNGHSAVPRMQSPEGHTEGAKTQPAKESLPAAQIGNNEHDNRKAPEPKISIHHKEANGVHRVLQKKAGMNIAPSHHPLRTSEYRRQFEKKTFAENSPLLAAEQVVYNKNQLVPPFKLSNPNIETEYKSQFKGSPPAKGPKLRKDWEDKHHTEYDQDHSLKRKDKKKTVAEEKSSSAKVITSDTEQKDTDRRNILKENFIKQLYSPTKYHRKVKTEYSANYVSPSEYRYKDGAWIRAKRHANDQVKELREKAEYYRRRAEGTHFSRDHLNQIISTKNKFWDVSSTSSGEEDMSNNIKALDLASLHSTSRNESRHQSPNKAKAGPNTGNLGVSDVPTLPVRRKLVWDECEETADVTPLELDNEEEVADAEDRGVVEENVEKYHEDNNEARPHAKKSSLSEEESECTSVTSGVEGRLPTPKLKTFGLAHRTHHDLTTPATGGALLVSPSKNHQRTPSPKRSSKKHDSPKKTVSKGVIERNEKRDDQQAAESPPVAGLKTVDPLPIREDPWPDPQTYNKPLPATIAYPVSRPVEYSYAPLPRKWSPSCRIQGALRDPEFQHNGNFNSFGFYSSAVNDNDSIEDDRLSQISARSAASSSLASQVLERAQKRKENFWGNK